MTEREKIVLVDMDNVMAGFDSAALVSVPHELIVPRSEFYVAHDYPQELRPSIENIYNAPGFFENLEPMPGLHQAWQAMLDHGYSPRVASAPLSSNKSAIEGKINWLDRVMTPDFGRSVIQNAIFDKDKWKYSGLALIDDRPSVPRGIDGVDSADWEHVLFGWAHLSAVPMATAAFRLLGWKDEIELIQTLDIIAGLRSH